jgi:hypothetical protein
LPRYAADAGIVAGAGQMGRIAQGALILPASGKPSASLGCGKRQPVAPK